MKTRVNRLVRAVRTAWTHSRAVIIPHSQLSELLVFGQQHLGTQRFFHDLFGQAHTIPLSRFPHYEYLDRHLDEEPTETAAYARYMRASWAYRFPDSNTPERWTERMGEFKQLYRDIEARKALGADAIRVPAIVCQRPDGRMIVVKGNHRAAAALKAGIDLRVTLLDPPIHLKKVAALADNADSSRSRIPPDSIFVGKDELVLGRQRHGLDRMNAVRSADLQGRSILELGCGLGSHCFLATQRGAVRAHGIDANPKMVSAAVRLNSFMAAPAYFQVQTPDGGLEMEAPAQTVLCFSFSNVMANEQLLRAISKPGTVFYFEGDVGTGEPDYLGLKRDGYFRTMELVGHVNTARGASPLFRCEVD